VWCGVMAPYSTGMEIASGPRATQNSDAITEKRQRRLQNLRPWRRLLTACGSNPLLNAVVTLALNTALRKNEIRTLRWSQIDFEKRTVTVGRAKTQAGSGRVIPLNQLAFGALAKWAGRLVESKAEDYVFPACQAAGIERKNPDMERIDPSRPIKSWRSTWRAALRRAGLQIRFHDLRHICITKLAESQASEHTLMAIAGHVSR